MTTKIKIVGWHIRVKNQWLGSTPTNSMCWANSRETAHLYVDYAQAARVFQVQCAATAGFGYLEVHPGDLALEAVCQSM